MPPPCMVRAERGPTPQLAPHLSLAPPLLTVIRLPLAIEGHFTRWLRDRHVAVRWPSPLALATSRQSPDQQGGICVRQKRKKEKQRLVAIALPCGARCSEALPRCILSREVTQATELAIMTV